MYEVIGDDREATRTVVILGGLGRGCLYLVVGALLCAWFVGAAQARGCPKGLAVDDPAYCPYFVEYKAPGSVAADDRLTSRFRGATSTRAPMRSFALVIGIDAYPNFQSTDDRTLPPSKRDADNLVAFLKEQGFDEIIFLHNEEATKEKINYLLDVYLSQQLDIFGAKARLLIAHTGHGAPGPATGAPGGIVLAHASGARDYANVYALNELAPKLRNLARKSYQFLALLGSCYSGGIFTGQAMSASNDWYPGAPGGHAVSSAPHDDMAYGLGGPNGSIFFDALIHGVRTGHADTLYAGWSAGVDGDLHLIGGGIVRLGALAGYVSGKIDALGKNPRTDKPFPQILLGSVLDGDHNGAFFFLGPPKAKSVTVSRQGNAAVVATDNTGSSVIDNADVKVFSPPDSYAVSGIDVSHYNKDIVWAATAKEIRFAYMKATESISMRDAYFTGNWTGAARAGVVRGAYHVFDYCEDIDKQLGNITRTVPKDPAAMPLAIDLQWMNGPTNPNQKACGGADRTRRRLLALASGLESFYAKRPVFFANQSGLNDLLDEEFVRFPIWLQQYGGADRDPLLTLKLKGRNPWTFWQYTSKGRVAGIKGPVDRNVFFGTPAALKDLIGGRDNPALRAARR